MEKMPLSLGVWQKSFWVSCSAFDIISRMTGSTSSLQKSLCHVLGQLLLWNNWRKKTSEKPAIQLTRTHVVNYKVEDGLWHPSVDVVVFSTSTACCDLDLWPPESNQIISIRLSANGYSLSVPLRLLKPFIIHEISWYQDLSGWINKRTNGWTARKHNALFRVVEANEWKL